MSENGRKQKVLKNVGSQMRAALIQSVLGFLSRKVLLDCLGENLLGLNSLMTSIIGMLSLVELGVGEAINFSLYEPLARDDRQQVAAIMRLYKKLYIGIGVAISLLGLALVPFLHFLVESQVPMSTVYWVYCIFLLDTFLSYCLAYNRNIIAADQKDYVIINTDTITRILLCGVQITCALLTRNYFLYLILQLVGTLSRNLYITFRVKKAYPYLRTEKPMRLSKEYLKKLYDNVKALFVTKLAYFCVNGTDNMLLSSFVSLASVAIYNNYVTIINLFNQAFNSVFTKATSVIGNYLVLENKDAVYPLFKRIFFINFLVTSYTSIGILVVSNYVVTVWMGAEMIWPVSILAIVLYNNYSRLILQTCEAFRGAAGLYSPRPFVKFLAFCEGILNLVASLGLIFVMENKVAAVFLGTSISTLVSTIAVPWIVYKFLFHRPLGEFFGIYLRYFAIMLLALFASSLVFNQLLTSSAILNVGIGIGVCTLITGGLYLLVFHRTEEFRYALNIAKKLILKRKATS